MRAVILPFAVAGLIGSASLGQAAPFAMPYQTQTEPALTLVKQGCGHGFQRGVDAKLDKWGKWHGGCMPRRAKAGAPMSPEGATTTRQLNQQELGRVQGVPPAR